MNKKLIIIIIVLAVILLGVGAVFMISDKDKNRNSLDPDTYVAEEHVFQSPDEVVKFLKNLYDFFGRNAVFVRFAFLKVKNFCKSCYN